MLSLGRGFSGWPWRTSQNVPKAAPAGYSQLGWVHPQPLTGGRCWVSEHCFISAPGAFEFFHSAAAGPKCRGFKDGNCCNVHAEGQVSGEETGVSSPGIKRPWRSLAGVQEKVTRLSKVLCFWHCRALFSQPAQQQ